MMHPQTTLFFTANYYSRYLLNQKLLYWN